jgi:hypothetical protein
VLRAIWTQEAADDLYVNYSVNAEAELVEALAIEMAAEISAEIDQEIIRDLREMIESGTLPSSDQSEVARFHRISIPLVRRIYPGIGERTGSSERFTSMQLSEEFASSEMGRRRVTPAEKLKRTIQSRAWSWKRYGF